MLNGALRCPKAVASSSTRAIAPRPGMDRRVGHRLDHVERGRAELAQRAHALLALLDRTGVADDHADDRLAAHRLGHEVERRRRDERDSRPDLVGGVLHKVAVEAHQVARRLGRVSDRSPFANERARHVRSG
jgi:hypothetical protein